jgi:hypothetical protein
LISQIRKDNLFLAEARSAESSSFLFLEQSSRRPVPWHHMHHKLLCQSGIEEFPALKLPGKFQFHLMIHAVIVLQIVN